MSPFSYISEKSSNFAEKEQNEIKKLQKLIIKELVICFAVFMLFIFQNSFSNNSKSTQMLAKIDSKPQVLGTITTPTEPPITPIPTVRNGFKPFPTTTIIPSPTPYTLNPTPSPAPYSGKPYKKHTYTIAIYGDSMVDTMGENLEYVHTSLKQLYPYVNFKLYNYGKGSENVEMSLQRIYDKLDYKDRHYPPITDLKPDLIIIGSFAYNPFSPFDKDRYWVAMTKLVEDFEKITPQVYMMAEINPLRKTFGKGPNGVNWDEQTAFNHSGNILKLMENTISLSGNLHIPLIDVFNRSINIQGLTDPNDGIHPSVKGMQFTANIIANTLNLNY
ncbi:MAG: SGNH/GDSL hydrolase family protein [bacterium]|nr:SGNH/GDSL hydrolase family protein [bacterium]